MSPLAVVGPLTDHASSPLGIDNARPRLSWQLTSPQRGARQVGYRVLVASRPALLEPGRADVWDSGPVSSGDSAAVYGGPALRSRDRCFWAAQATSPDGSRSPWSEPAWWEMGLLDASEWQARWIRLPDPHEPEPLLRKAFVVDKPVERARVYASGLGYMELSMNGRRLGQSVLDPAFTRYDRRVGYVTYDVTDSVESGDNIVAARLGRGFFGSTTPNAWEWERAPWLEAPQLLLQLELAHPDGTTTTVVTDETWSAAEGPGRWDSVYGGETYEAGLDPVGWDGPGFDASGWAPAAIFRPPAGRLVARSHEPIEVVETLTPVRVTEVEPGVHLFDFGVVVAGWVRIRVEGPAGTRLVIRYDEKLVAETGRVLSADFERRGDNLFVAGRFQTDEYLLAGSGSVETWEPRWSYKGFQYAEISGWPGTPTVDDIDGRVVHSAVASTGGFACSDDLLTTLHGMARRTLLNNLHGIPTDTPMYEKNGWTGDAQLVAEAALFNFDMARIYTKWLDDIRDSQGDDGLVAVIAPDGGWGLRWSSDSPPWGGAYVLVAWSLYLHTGDDRVLVDHFDAMKRYVDREIARAPDGIHSSALGDYMAPGRYGDEGQSPEDLALIGTAYAYRIATTLAEMAATIGRADDAGGLRAAAARIKGVFNATWLDTERSVYRTTTEPTYRQTPNLLAVAFGLVPDDREGAVIESVAADVRALDNHLNTGALGTKYLWAELTTRGHGEVAFAAATQRTHPGFGYWIGQGATTFWEYWGDRARSHDHAFLGGSIDEWFFTCLLGIAPAAPGFSEVRIRPWLPDRLDWVEGHTVTPRGPVRVRCNRSPDGAVRLDVSVPANVVASVQPPAPVAAAIAVDGRPAGEVAGVTAAGIVDGRPAFEVGSGDYRFSWAPA